MTIDHLRYVALRPFTFEGRPYSPGDTLPSPINPFILRHLVRTGMVDKTLPVALAQDLLASRPAGAQKEPDDVHEPPQPRHRPRIRPVVESA